MRCDSTHPVCGLTPPELHASTVPLPYPKHKRACVILNDVADLIEELEQAVRAHAAALAAVQRARSSRDSLIAAAFAAGAPIRVIASVVGLTPSRVASILGHPMGTPGRPAKPRTG